ncbi:MAG: hypothetical protein Q9227_006730 [Pyrenula ochraceoflavens]
MTLHDTIPAAPPSQDKKSSYAELITSLGSLLNKQRNWVAATANTSALLHQHFHSLPSPSSHVNWTGFYVLDPLVPRSLILGPFQGKVACQTISFDRGVCGKAAREGKSIIVHDVHEFEGHIACDADSRSEIVVPILVREKVVGLIDIDCTEVGGFDEADRESLQVVAQMLGEACDW